MEPQLSQGVALEQLQVQAGNVRTGLGADGGHQEGMGIGIGIAEAAGIGGHAHIEGVGNVRIHFHTQNGQNVADDLSAGGAVRIHQFLFGEGGAAAVVVDAQLALLSQVRKIPGQHIGSRHVHRHDGIAVIGKILGDVVQQPAKTIQGLGGVQNPGILAHFLQA